MFIAFDDPIWMRLYGVHGQRDVAGVLETLSRCWDERTARALYWDKLHDQDDLYPATFAALPWVWHIAPRPLEAMAETPLFLSHVLDCALGPGGMGPRGEGPRGRYRGLVLDVNAHQLSWIHVEHRPRAKDMPTLERLEAWFTQAVPEIADACMDLVSDNDPFRSANLLRGPATMMGAWSLPIALALWGGGEEMGVVLKEAPAETAGDLSAAVALASRVEARSHDLARFLREWAAAGRGEWGWGWLRRRWGKGS